MNTKVERVSSRINEIYLAKVFLILERKTDRLKIEYFLFRVIFLWEVDTTQSWPAISHTFDPMDSQGPFSIRRDAGETLHSSPSPSSASFSASVLPVLRASYYLSIVSLVR